MTTLTENQGRVAEVLLEIINLKGLATPTMSSETVLEQLGLESLDFAQMVIRMEEITGKDPFATGAEFQIRTLADLAACYD
jgi:acyl carrier protein